MQKIRVSGDFSMKIGYTGISNLGGGNLQMGISGYIFIYAQIKC